MNFANQIIQHFGEKSLFTAENTENAEKKFNLMFDYFCITLNFLVAKQLKTKNLSALGVLCG